MLKSHELLGFMSPALAADILSFTFESDRPAYRATMAAVADAQRVRPVFLERQSRDARHATMASALAKPTLDGAAAALLRAWLVKKHEGSPALPSDPWRQSVRMWRTPRYREPSLTPACPPQSAQPAWHHPRQYPPQIPAIVPQDEYDQRHRAYPGRSQYLFLSKCLT